MDELQAAILSAKLPYLNGWNARRREIAARYSKGLRHKRDSTTAGFAEVITSPTYMSLYAKIATIYARIWRLLVLGPRFIFRCQTTGRRCSR